MQRCQRSSMQRREPASLTIQWSKNLNSAIRRRSPTHVLTCKVQHGASLCKQCRSREGCEHCECCKKRSQDHLRMNIQDKINQRPHRKPFQKCKTAQQRMPRILPHTFHQNIQTHKFPTRVSGTEGVAKRPKTQPSPSSPVKKFPTGSTP